MKLPAITYILLLVLCVVSCHDDPVLIEKQAKQKLEIARLTGEIALIEEKLNNLPPDVSEEITKTKTQIAEKNAEVIKLEGEISGLEARKKELQAEFDKYRAKYQTK